MTFISILLTLLIFTVIVVAHEWGHFIAARKNDIIVEEFAVGMGPLVFGITKGETLYSLRLFPIGGYCKMLGEDGESDNPRAFSSKKVWQRMTVCVAGVIMNFLLAVVLGSILFSFYWFRDTTVIQFTDNSPAYSAGIMAGDKIVKIDGQAIRAYEYIGQVLSKTGGKPVEVVVIRDGAKEAFTVTPEHMADENGASGYKMGIYTGLKAGIFNSELKAEYPAATVFETVEVAFGKSMFYVRIVVDGLSQLIRREVSMDDMAGPIGVGQIVDSNLQAAVKEENAALNIMLFVMNLSMLLSANLAVMNLLPIPALDGGRLLFLLIEGVRRRPMNPEREGLIHFVGFVLVMVLAVLVAFNDVTRLF